MQKQDYISLIAKNLTNESNHSDSELLNSLTKENQEVREAYEDMQDIWDKSGTYAPNVSFDSVSAFDKFAAKYKIPTDSTTKTGNFDYKLVLISIVIALLVSSSIFVYFSYFNKDSFNNNSATNQEYVFKGNTFMMAPGSEVKFNKDGSVYDVSGSVFFKEANDIALQYGSKTITSGDSAAFNLSKDNDSDELRFDVTEGSLSITDQANSNASTAISENSTLFLGINDVEIADLDANAENHVLWASNRLSFNKTHIEDVFKDLESFFGIEVVIDGDIPTDCHFTAPVIKEPSVMAVFELLHSSFNFKLTKEVNGSYMVSSITCQ